ncbi:hypothetical protein CYMTET_44397 [Cymbomonas tetramitiformis]|uniref:Uncharacterized protein n=1 Tax=Cymbomonas tetramitiformis TaxID=36881 RepID=A0AAE0C0C8_9CHLO|nr:hypothetical protein CYMTET_44397 [Cymbomonas tetramitiformis]
MNDLTMLPAFNPLPQHEDGCAAPLAATVSADQTLRLWDTTQKECFAVESFLSSLPAGPYTAVAPLPSTDAAFSQLCIAANFEGVMQIWGVDDDPAFGLRTRLLAHTSE